MKVTLYIRATRAGHAALFTRLEEEPNYGDTPRTISLGQDVAKELDAMIERCAAAGAVAKGKRKGGAK